MPACTQIAPDRMALAASRRLLAEDRLEDAQAALALLVDVLAQEPAPTPAEALSPLAPPSPNPPAGLPPALQKFCLGEARFQRDFWHDAAGALRDAGLFDAALAAWQRARACGLDGAVTEVQLGVTLLAAGRFAEARDTLAARAAADPRNATVAHLLATALLEAGGPAEALARWETAGRLAYRSACPLDTNPLYLALGVAALERYVAAAPPTETGPVAAGRAPGRGPGKRLARIAAEAEAGRLAQALAWVETELTGNPQTADDLHQLRAWLFLEEGRPAEARAEVARLAAANPDAPMLLSLLALCLARTGQAAWALRLLQYVPIEGPDDYFRHYHAGLAHAMLGDRVRALVQFRRAFQDFFYDTYHSLMPTLWRRARARMAAGGDAAERSAP